MKKNRILSLFLSMVLGASLLSVPALAAANPSTAAEGEVIQEVEDHQTASADQSQIIADMHVDAGSAILVDADTGEILYEQDAHTKRYPASITKVMTCLLTLEAVDRGELSLEDVVTASGNLHAGIGENASTADIKEGEQLRVIDLLYAALIPSANEACNVLAETVSGSVDAFVDLMNQRAAELGMTGTHFANTHGYHDDDHYTTAYDIYLMSAEAMKYETFRTIVSSKNYTMPATNMHEERIVRSTNGLISTFNVTGYWYEYAIGVKTGYTPEAGYCLSAAAEKNGKMLISVVMDCTRVEGTTGSEGFTYFSETVRLLNWGFSNFSQQVILDDSAMDFPEIAVTLSKEADYVTVHPSGALTITLPDDVDITSFERVVDCPETVEAPVEAGQVLGKVTMTYNGQEYGSLDLVANSAVERSELLYRLDQIQKFFSQLWVRVVLIVLAVVIVILILRALIFGKRRSSARSRYSGRRRR